MFKIKAVAFLNEDGDPVSEERKRSCSLEGFAKMAGVKVDGYASKEEAEEARKRIEKQRAGDGV